MAQVHIMYDGKAEDLELGELIPVGDRPDLGIDDDHELTSTELSGDQIKRALANHYDKPVEEFEELVVEFHKNGNITCRPNATFGI